MPAVGGLSMRTGCLRRSTGSSKRQRHPARKQDDRGESRTITFSELYNPRLMHIVYDSPPRRVVAHRLSEADFLGISGLFGKPKGLKARGLERRTEELFVNGIEIDLQRFVRSLRSGRQVNPRFLRHLLFSKRHDHEDSTPEAQAFRCHGAITASHLFRGKDIPSLRVTTRVRKT